MDLDLPTPPEESTKKLRGQTHMTWSSLMSKFNGPKSGKTIAVMLRIITRSSSDTLMPLMRRIDRCQSSPIKSIKQAEKQTKSFTTD